MTHKLPKFIPKSRERKMRTNFFGANFLNTRRGPGHAGKIPGTSQIPLLETQRRQTFGGGHELFGHPFAWKTPTPPGGLRTPKFNLLMFELFFWGVSKGGFLRGGEISRIGVVRAPVAIINFAFFVRGLLIESYINSEIFTGI